MHVAESYESDHEPEVTTKRNHQRVMGKLHVSLLPEGNAFARGYQNYGRANFSVLHPAQPADRTGTEGKTTYGFAGCAISR